MNLPDAELLLAALADKLKPLIKKDTALVGIHSGGAWMTERLLPILGGELAHGMLDISFYRDDYNQRGLHANKPSQIPFDVQDKHIILIDDVFYTGRTIRAAMDAMIAFGRPAKVELLVMIDRRYNRELPIAPDYVGRTVNTLASQRVLVELQAQGHKQNKIWLINKD